MLSLVLLDVLFFSSALHDGRLVPVVNAIYPGIFFGLSCIGQFVHIFNRTCQSIHLRRLYWRAFLCLCAYFVFISCLVCSHFRYNWLENINTVVGLWFRFEMEYIKPRSLVLLVRIVVSKDGNCRLLEMEYSVPWILYGTRGETACYFKTTKKL